MKLRCKHMSAGYNGRAILHDINVEATHGDLIFLIGKNGSGKSTLINSISGIQSLIEGNCFLNDLSVKDYAIQSRSRLVSVVSSGAERIDYMKVSDYVAFGRMPYTNYLGALSKEDQSAIDQAMTELKISELRDQYITEISDGEFRKVQLAKVVCQRTDILLADEPVTHLDIGSRVEIFKLLEAIAKSGKIVIIATHEIEMALKMASQIWLVHEGMLTKGNSIDLIQSGRLDEVFGNEFISFKKTELQKYMHKVV